MKEKNKLIIKSKLKEGWFRGIIYNNAMLLTTNYPEADFEELIKMALDHYVETETYLTNFDKKDILDIDALNAEWGKQ